MPNSAIFLKRVLLSNYKSIKACSVPLGPLTFLVGQNGAGKSNFLDALRLVSESLNTSLEHALRERGGIKEVRRRSAGHPTHFEFAWNGSCRTTRKVSMSFAWGLNRRADSKSSRKHVECSPTTQWPKCATGLRMAY